VSWRRSSIDLLSGALAQFVEQPRVLDSGDRWGCEILHHLNLFVCERPDLLAKNGDCTDELIILKDRHTTRGSETTEFDSGDDKRVAFTV
jgi:hypothetical protein